VTRHFVGLDLGQARDFSALADIERSEVAAGVDGGTREAVAERRYRLRFLERLDLGTPYPQVVARAASVCAKLAPVARVAREVPELVVDATGVGRVVVDLLRWPARRTALADRAPYALVPVTITSGDRVSLVEGFFRVPKRELVSALVVLLQSGSLAIASGLPLADALMSELLNFRMSVSAAGNDTYGNWREAKNDDLVLAVALAAWRASLSDAPPVLGSRRLL